MTGNTAMSASLMLFLLIGNSALVSSFQSGLGSVGYQCQGRTHKKSVEQSFRTTLQSRNKSESGLALLQKASPHAANFKRQHSSQTHLRSSEAYHYSFAPPRFPTFDSSSLSIFPRWQDDFLREYNDEWEQPQDDRFQDVDLSYLPVDLFDLPPKTEELLRKVTHMYVMSDVKNSQRLEVEEVLDAIHSEYHYTAVPCSIGSIAIMTSDLEQKMHTYGTDTSIREYISKVLSFSAMHYLPEEITKILLEAVLPSSNNINDDDERAVRYKILQSSKYAFQNGGWKAVSFEGGFSIRLKRNYIVSKRSKFSPIPRNSRFTRKRDITEASRALNVASIVSPPPKAVNTQNMLDAINQIERELIVDSPQTFATTTAADRSFNNMLTFFPKNRTWQQFVISTARNTNNLKAAGIAGMVAYSILSLLWYAIAIGWQWRQVNDVPVDAAYNVVKMPIRKFARMFMSAYVGSAITKIPRLSLAVAMAPFGDNIWKLIKRKMNEDKTVRIVTICAGVWFGMWALLSFGHATFSIFRVSALSLK